MPDAPLRLLVLAAHPAQAASVRYRALQYLPFLRARGVEATVLPFLSPSTFAALYRPGRSLATARDVAADFLRYLSRLHQVRRADVLWIEREALPIGPPIFEALATLGFRKPLILDMDDAVYLERDGAVHGRWIRGLKCFWKTDLMIRWAKRVVCGNAQILSYAAALRPEGLALVPTAVDTLRFSPAPEPARGTPVVGWIGSPSAARFLLPILPVLEEIGRSRRFRLKFVGAGREFSVPGVPCENLEWSEAREVEDFRSLDIGLYPLPDTAIAAGKSALKAIHYMSVGIPFVASPIGMVKNVVEAYGGGLAAPDLAGWKSALERLLDSAELRESLARRGREAATRMFDVRPWAEVLADLIRRPGGSETSELERRLRADLKV